MPQAAAITAVMDAFRLRYDINLIHGLRYMHVLCIARFVNRGRLAVMELSPDSNIAGRGGSMGPAGEREGCVHAGLRYRARQWIRREWSKRARQGKLLRKGRIAT